MEIAENRMLEDNYLLEGMVTKFSGIPFDSDHPYDYNEARRLIKLAMDELRCNSVLTENLGMNPKSGRGAITGKGRTSVWDFLAIEPKLYENIFTKSPHLTLSVHFDGVEAGITLPNGLRTQYRKNLISSDYQHFLNVMEQTATNLNRSLGSVEGAVPRMYAVQRRYNHGQKGESTIDARVSFDLRTAIGKSLGDRHPVKKQPEWLEASYEAFKNKRSNLQMGIGAFFPYASCPSVHSAKILDHVAAAWLACRPILRVVIGN